MFSEMLLSFMTKRGRRICKAEFVIVKVSQYAGYYACNGSFKTVTFESLGNSPPISRKRMFGGILEKFVYFIMKLHAVCTH